MIELGLLVLVVFWIYKLVTYKFDPEHFNDDSFF